MIKITIMDEQRALIEAELADIETYPAWQTTALAHVKIYDKEKNRWTDCWLSCINKNRRIKFFLTHEKGYPSQNKGTSERELLAHWLSVDIPRPSA